MDTPKELSDPVIEPYSPITISLELRWQVQPRKPKVAASERNKKTKEFIILTPTVRDRIGLRRWLSNASPGTFSFDSEPPRSYGSAVSSKSKTPVFESSLQELEKIILALEKGEQPLEEQLKAFERGVTLSRECLKQLDEVEKKVQLLLQDESGGLSSQDFLK